MPASSLLFSYCVNRSLIVCVSSWFARNSAALHLEPTSLPRSSSDWLASLLLTHKYGCSLQPDPPFSSVEIDGAEAQHHHVHWEEWYAQQLWSVAFAVKCSHMHAVRHFLTNVSLLILPSSHAWLVSKNIRIQGGTFLFELGGGWDGSLSSFTSPPSSNLLLALVFVSSLVQFQTTVDQSRIVIQYLSFATEERTLWCVSKL